MRAAGELRFGPDGLAGRTVGVEGVGKVGARLVALLADAGVARVLVSDPDAGTIERIRSTAPNVTAVDSVIAEDVDVYAPCALGGTLSRESVRELKAAVVCGGANNQLLTSDVADDLRDRDILWVPDYVANAGGVVQVGGELFGATPDEVTTKVEAIAATTTEILTRAQELGITTRAAADAVVEERLAARREEIVR